MPGVPVLVVDDCSADATVIWRARPARACWRCRIIWAWAVRAGGIPAGVRAGISSTSSAWMATASTIRATFRKMLEALEREECEMVIGSRFVERLRAALRGCCARWESFFFARCCGRFSGKSGARPDVRIRGREPHRAGSVFSRSFPLEYPEIEALVVLQRRRFRFVEVPCRMRPRRTGRSTITPLKSLYYIVHVLLGVFVNVLKFEGRRK